MADQTIPARWVLGDKAGASLRLLCEGSMRGNWRYSALCPRGHAYTFGNTRITKEGWKVCRQCDRERKRRAKEASK